MEKIFEGYVERDLEYGYMGVDCADVPDEVEGILRRYEGKKIKLTLTIEEVEEEYDPVKDYEDMYCEECGGTACHC